MKGEERHEVYSSQSFIQEFKLGGWGDFQGLSPLSKNSIHNALLLTIFSFSLPPLSSSSFLSLPFPSLAPTSLSLLPLYPPILPLPFPSPSLSFHPTVAMCAHLVSPEPAPLQWVGPQSLAVSQEDLHLEREQENWRLWQLCSQTSPLPLTVCKYRVGRLGRSGHMHEIKPMPAGILKMS